MSGSVDHDRRDAMVSTRSARIAGVIGELARECHWRIREELPPLHDILGDVIEEHGDADTALPPVGAGLANLGEELCAQVRFEERTLFPLAIRMLGSVVRPTSPDGDVPSLVSQAQEGYDSVGHAFDDVVRLMAGVSPATGAAIEWLEFRSRFDDLALATRRSISVARRRLLPDLVSWDGSLVT